MSKLSNKSTTDDDLFPSFVVKHTRCILAKPLSIIINLAIDNIATFPDGWKRTRVTLVFEKGDPNQVCSYRSISILTNFAKIFELSID